MKKTSPWLVRKVVCRVDAYRSEDDMAWLCGKKLASYFNLPRGKPIQIVVSSVPVRGAIKVTDYGGMIETDMGEFSTFASLSDFLGATTTWWAWIEYEV